MKCTKTNRWLGDFNDFLESEEITPSERATSEVKHFVHHALNPSFTLVFGKALVLHMVAASVTLLFCPQFGFGFPLFAEGGLIMPLFMAYGGLVCAIACGAFFLSVSGLLVAFWLRPEELRVVKRTELVMVSVLAALSWGGFMLNGAEPDLDHTLGWVLGAWVGGLISFHAGLLLRRKSVHISPLSDS